MPPVVGGISMGVGRGVTVNGSNLVNQLTNKAHGHKKIPLAVDIARGCAAVLTVKVESAEVLTSREIVVARIVLGIKSTLEQQMLINRKLRFEMKLWNRRTWRAAFAKQIDHHRVRVFCLRQIFQKQGKKNSIFSVSRWS